MGDKEVIDLEKMLNEEGFRNKGINPDSAFNEHQIIYRFGELEKLRGYAKRAKEPGNPVTGLRKDVTEVLFGSKLKGEGIKLNELTFKEMAKRGLETFESRFAMHVYNHWDQYMSSIENADNSADILMDLVQNKNVLLKIEGDPMHNKVYNLIEAAKEADAALKAAGEGNLSKMEKIVGATLKTRKLSDWESRLIKEFLWDEAFVKLMFNAEYSTRKSLAQTTILDGKGRVDIKGARKLIDKSKREAWRLYEDETMEGIKGDIMDDDLTPYALNIAEGCVQAEYPKYVKDVIDRYPEAEDQDERAQDRKFAGMGTGRKKYEEQREFALTA